MEKNTFEKHTQDYIEKRKTRDKRDAGPLGTEKEDEFHWSAFNIIILITTAITIIWLLYEIIYVS